MRHVLTFLLEVGAFWNDNGAFHAMHRHSHSMKKMKNEKQKTILTKLWH